MNKDILYIVVIYGIAKEDSSAWQSLQQHLTKEEMTQQVYVHDNSEHNVYLAAAYNKGWEYATQHGFRYIVLLDDDACLTDEYITAVRRIAASGDTQTVWAPILENKDGQRLSPRHRLGMKVAFNSGLLLPVHVIREIGGFDTDYPMDYLDYRICYQLQQQGIKLCTLPVRMRHDLSLNDYSHISRERYLALLQAERRFAQDSHHMCRYRLLLTARLIKWVLTGHPYVKNTYQALMKR